MSDKAKTTSFGVLSFLFLIAIVFHVTGWLGGSKFLLWLATFNFWMHVVLLGLGVLVLLGMGIAFLTARN